MPWNPPPVDETEDLPPVDETEDLPPVDDEIPAPERTPSDVGIAGDPQVVSTEVPDPERMFDESPDPWQAGDAFLEVTGPYGSPEAAAWARNRWDADTLGELYSQGLSGFGHPQYGTPEAAAWARNRFDADTLRRLRDQGLSGFDAELPELQYGGQTRGTRALITGDSSFGRPNPELVLNPTGAPLKVIPMNQMSPRAARMAQFGRLPRAEHGFPHQTVQGQTALPGFNYTIPDFPVPPMFTQAGIIGRKQAFLPPGPRDVFAGRQPAPLEFGFRMPTPGLMGSLTPNERAAFGSQLASEYNTSLGEVESGIRQRFGQTRRAPRARRARY